MILFEDGSHKIETSGRLLNTEEKARKWRDSELLRTDIMTQPDRPDAVDISSYRQALRDWPSTENFPETKPEL
jgi:hypothetical protein